MNPNFLPITVKIIDSSFLDNLNAKERSILTTNTAKCANAIDLRFFAQNLARTQNLFIKHELFNSNLQEISTNESFEKNFDETGGIFYMYVDEKVEEILKQKDNVIAQKDNVIEQKDNVIEQKDNDIKKNEEMISLISEFSLADIMKIKNSFSPTNSIKSLLDELKSQVKLCFLAQFTFF